MKKEFKAHPLMILSYIKPFLLLLLIPVVRGSIQYIKNGEVTQILGLEIFVLALVILVGFLRWYFFRLTVTHDTIAIRDGVFIRRAAVIPVNLISSVQSEQTPFDFIFKSVTFRINTEAGNLKTTDYSFKLSRNDAHALSDLLYGQKSGEPVRFSPIKIAILAAATSSAFTGMLVGVPILKNAAKLAGMGINELLDQINSVSGKFQTYFPPIVNTVSLVLLASFIISFFYSFLRHINFRLFLNEDRIEVRSGFFVMLRTSFKKKSVNNVIIEQTILMHLLKRYEMKVNVGGYGEAKSESQVLVPSGRYKEIKEMFSDYFPFLKPMGPQLKSNVGIVHENRYLFWAEIFFALLLVTAIITANLFGEFGNFIIFMTAIIGCIIFYYAYLCRWEYKNCALSFSETVFVKGKKGLRRCRLYCPRDNVGDIKLIRFPPDSIFKTCNVKITVRSETADNITVRHTDYEQTKEEIFRCYGITE